MADPWIKMRVTLATSPQVIRLAAALPLSADCPHRMRTSCAVGLLHQTWAIADTHTEDGELVGYTPEALDSIVGVPGWAAALESVGWLAVTGSGLRIPAFDEHNGASAKRRSKEAKRKADVRKLSAPDADKCPQAKRPSSSSSSSSMSVPRERGVRGDQPPGIGSRLAKVLDAELDPIDERAMALIVRLDRQTRQARAESDRGMAPEMGEAAWRKAIQRARSAPDAFEEMVELTEVRSAANLQVPEPGKPGRNPQTDKLTPRGAQQRREDETIARMLERELADGLHDDARPGPRRLAQ